MWAQVRTRMSKAFTTTRSNNHKYNIVNLESHKVKGRYQRNISEVFGGITNCNDIEQLIFWEATKETIGIVGRDALRMEERLERPL